MKKSKLLGLLGLEKIMESLQNLIEVRIAIVKDEIESQVTEKVVGILPLILVIACSSLLILFASLTLSFYLTDVTGSYVYGFGLVSLGYLLLTIIFYLLKDNKRLKEIFSKSITKDTKDH